jgi:hypothetical protein
MSRLQHPHIVQVYEVGEHEGGPYMALEYMSGGSLDQRLKEKPLPARQSAELVQTVAHAVQHAHERNIQLRPLLEDHRTKTFKRKRRQLATTGHEWTNGGRKWPEPNRECVLEIEQAHGLVGATFALCPSLPLERASAVTDGLRGSGYRPVRVRPWMRAGSLMVAVVWTRA